MNSGLILALAGALSLLFALSVTAEQIRISGLVTDKDNIPQRGALVRVIGFSNTAWTRADGAYSLTLDLRGPVHAAKMRVHKKGFEVGEEEIDLDTRIKRTYIVDVSLYRPGEDNSSFLKREESLEDVARNEDGLPDPPNFGKYTSDYKPPEKEKKLLIFHGKTIVVEEKKPVRRTPHPPPVPTVPAGPPYEVLISGRVQTQRGRPIGGASVFVPGRAACKSDRRGRYKLLLRFARSVARASVTVIAQHRNFMKMQYPVQIRPAVDQEIRIPIKMPRYRGLIR